MEIFRRLSMLLSGAGVALIISKVRNRKVRQKGDCLEKSRNNGVVVCFSKNTQKFFGGGVRL